jgi:hypothetical protein
MMLGYARGRHFMAKTTPFLMLRTMMTSTTQEPQIQLAKVDDLRQALDESDQGPKRAIAGV